MVMAIENCIYFCVVILLVMTSYHTLKKNSKNAIIHMKKVLHCMTHSFGGTKNPTEAGLEHTVFK